ncbi:MAG: IS21 family transposase, partial [Trueperaceae bacterium]|nr:IS21 family transposase [Trueperaceae bacterium]
EASLRSWAARVGPGAVRFTDALFTSRAHPHQAMRSCLGVLRLGKRYGDVRLDAACARALALGSVTFKSVDAILKNHLDEQPLETRPEAPLPKAAHENVRGGEYFATTPRARDDGAAPAGGAAC